jgi:hypothetical protein
MDHRLSSDQRTISTKPKRHWRYFQDEYQDQNEDHAFRGNAHLWHLGGRANWRHGQRTRTRQHDRARDSLEPPIRRSPNQHAVDAARCHARCESGWNSGNGNTAAGHHPNAEYNAGYGRSGLNTRNDASGYDEPEFGGSKFDDPGNLAEHDRTGHDLSE